MDISLGTGSIHFSCVIPYNGVVALLVFFKFNAGGFLPIGSTDSGNFQHRRLR